MTNSRIDYIENFFITYKYPRNNIPSDMVYVPEPFDFKPEINVEEGVHNFVKWYREYYKV